MYHSGNKNILKANKKNMRVLLCSNVTLYTSYDLLLNLAI